MERVSINESPDMAVVEFPEYKVTRPSRAVYPSRAALASPQATKSVPKGPAIPRSMFVDEKEADVGPEPIDDDSFFEPIYSNLTFQAQKTRNSASPLEKSPGRNTVESPSPQKVHPFYAKNRIAVMAKINNLLKAKGPPRALSPSPPPSIRPQS